MTTGGSRDSAEWVELERGRRGEGERERDIEWKIEGERYRR